MNNATNTCNHTEEIAHAIYSQHHNELNPGIPPDWDALPEEEKQAWRKVAGNILPTLGQHALGDLLAYAKRKIKESSSTGKKILWGLVSAAVLAALSWLASLGLTSCGHTVDISQEGTAICKDGTCLIVKDGHVIFRPAPEKDSPREEETAVIRQQK